LAKVNRVLVADGCKISTLLATHTAQSFLQKMIEVLVLQLSDFQLFWFPYFLQMGNSFSLAMMRSIILFFLSLFLGNKNPNQ
jgi:tRNA U38,U39,U40 pseudouridine synthase TruA